MARMEDDGIDQAQYKVKEKMMTDVYTKIIADLSYTNYINTYVSITSSRCATFRGTLFCKNYLIFLITCFHVLTVFVICIYRTILNCLLSLRGIKRKNTMVILKV